MNQVAIDQVDFRNITARFQLSVSGEEPVLTVPEIRAIPQAGGQITGEGQVELEDTPTVGFTLCANDISGDAIY